MGTGELDGDATGLGVGVVATPCPHAEIRTSSASAKRPNCKPGRFIRELLTNTREYRAPATDQSSTDES